MRTRPTLSVPRILGHFLLMLLCAPFWMLLSADAQAQTQLKDETDAVYLGHRVTLIVSLPRQLTIGAHIEDFAWSPDGKRIADLTRSADGNDSAIATLRPEGGRPRVYYQDHVEPDDPFAANGPNPYAIAGVDGLAGWSPDGDHLAFIAGVRSPLPGGFTMALYDIDMARGVAQSIPLFSNADPNDQIYALISGGWSPRRDVLALKVFAKQAADAHAKFHLLLYDAKTRTTRMSDFSPGYFSLNGWTGDDRVLISAEDPGGAHQSLIADGATGRVSPMPSPAPAAVSVLRSRAFEAGAAGTVTLSLRTDADGPQTEVAERKQVKDSDGSSHGMEAHLWATVTQHADLARPPHAARLLIDTYRATPGSSTGPVQIAPVRRDAPGVAQVAYLISGDLYVAGITTRAPTIQELVAANETLTCPEEQQLAILKAKILGAVLIQYDQDHQEHWPPAADFEDEVTPYAKDGTLFKVGDYPFHYLLDGGSVNDMEAPSATATGYYDLPCGRVVLWSDGHARLFKPTDVQSDPALAP